MGTLKPISPTARMAGKEEGMRTYMLLVLVAMLFVPSSAQAQIWRTRDIVTNVAAGYDRQQCERDQVYRPGRYSRSCGRYARRVDVGQIDRLERNRHRSRYGSGYDGGIFGGFDRYRGRRDGRERTRRVRERERTERIGIGVGAGIEVLGMVLEHKRESREQDMREEAMRPREETVVIVQEPTSTTRTASPMVHNRTQCDLILKESGGRTFGLMKGQSSEVSSTTGLSARVVNGQGQCELLLTQVSEGDAMLSCEVREVR